MRRIDIESILKLFDELKSYTLIVEGRKDERALKAAFSLYVPASWKTRAAHLKALGLMNIIPLNGQPLVEIVEGIDERSHVVILTDFDKEGKRLCAKLLKLLQRRRIKANPRLRHMLMDETGIARIEELDTAVGAALTKKEKGDTHGEIGANFYEIYSKGKHKGKRHRREA
jgi:5S rRNA maturation endonuclease (ribonuclease M5)